MKSHQRQRRPNGLIKCSLVLLLFCCLPLSSAEVQKEPEISTFPFEEKLSLSRGDMEFYLLDGSKVPRGFGVLISTHARAGFSAPTLFINDTKEFSVKMNDPDFSSISVSKQILFLSDEDLKDRARKLYIGVICEEGYYCRGSLTAEWAKEIKAIANGEKTAVDAKSLNETKAAIFRLRIPKEDHAERIIVSAGALMVPLKQGMGLQFDMFIDQGMAIPETRLERVIEKFSVWFKGSTMIIEKDSSLFCTDCLLTLRLAFGPFFAISVQAKTFKKNTELSGAILLDAVQYSEEYEYSFTGRQSQKDEDFILSVKVQEGKVIVYITCDTKPETSADYYWKEVVKSSKEIILSPNNRSNCSTENYFFLVYGRDSSVYSLQATYKQPNQLLLRTMGEAVSRTGELLPQEKVTFEILVRAFTAEEILLDLNFSHPLDLNIINCRFPADCPGYIPLVKEPAADYNGYDGFEKFTYSSEEISENGLGVKINPQESGCYPIFVDNNIPGVPNFPVCAYLVTLSNQQQSSVVEYSLTTKYKGPTLLPLGESKFDVVAKNESRFYVFHPSEHDTKTMQVQLTKFSGHCDVFVSKTHSNPSKEDENEILASYEGLIILPIDPEDSGTYYVRVHGQEKCSFAISAISCKDDTDWESLSLNEYRALTLTPGKPQKGVLFLYERDYNELASFQKDEQYRMQHYKIVLNQDENWKGIVRITVNPLGGWVWIRASTSSGRLTEESSMWSTTNNVLDISSDDKNFKAQGVYHIIVSSFGGDLLNDKVYHITYSIIDDLPNAIHTLLSPNTPFYGTKKKNETHYFEAILFADQAPVNVYKYSKSREIEIYISTDPNNKYPSQDSYTDTTKDQNRDYVTVKSCEGSEANLCSVYITVVSSGPHSEAFYSLSIFSTDHSSAPLGLVEGREIQSVVPKDSNSPAVLYYHAFPEKTSVVTVASPGREVLAIYAKRMKVDIESFSDPDVKPLQEIDAEFMSQGSHSFITVPPLRGSDWTILAISVYFKEALDTTAFTILASSKIIEVSSGKLYEDIVRQDHYVYFMVNIAEPTSTLKISLENKYGDADIVIGRGYYARPTTSDNQFAIISDKKAEVIEINNNNFTSMSGAWIIGVYGNTSSMFSLTFDYEELKMQKLKLGGDIQMSLEGPSSICFKYTHQEKENIQIGFLPTSGQVNLYITSIDLNQDYIVNLPTQARHKWQIPSSGGDIIFHPHSSEACISCEYIMKVEAASSSRFSIIVRQLADILNIENRLQYKGGIKPQNSIAYLFENPQTIYDYERELHVELKGGDELAVFASKISSIDDDKNYIWNETLTSVDSYKVIRLQEKTQNGSYYIILNNPTNQNLNYSFYINPKMIQVDRNEEVYHLGLKQKKFFEYVYVGRDNTLGLDIDVIFYAVQKEREDFMRHVLRQGQTLELQPLPRKFREESDFVFTAKEYPESTNNATHAIVQQRFSGSIPETEAMKNFQLMIENPWPFNVSFRLSIGEPLPGLTKAVQAEGVSTYDL